MKSRRIVAFVLILTVITAIFFTGCQNNRLKTIYYKFFDVDENGNIIVPEGYIGISVYGKDGENFINTVFVDSNYKKEISVADLSRDICRELKIPIVFAGTGTAVYVQGINSLFEFDNGPESGWLYSVNGEYKGTGCGTYILQDGDYVEWRYTLDLGRDLGAFIFDE